MGADAAEIFGEEGRKGMTIDWEKVKAALAEMGLAWQEREPDMALARFMEQCGYIAQPMVVDLASLDHVTAKMGVVATHRDEGTNNGIYVFCVLEDGSLGLLTVVPSTVSKAPMIRRLAGDLTDAVTGVVLPPLTAFDMVEIVGQVLVNTVMKDLMMAFGVPKEKEHAFTCVYLPQFLADVAMHWTGAVDKDGKPLVNEEIVDMGPARVRQMVMDEALPDIFRKPENGSEGRSEDICSEKPTGPSA